MKKCAIITGIYGQDGSLLAEYLLAREYRVVGLVTRLRQGFSGIESAEIFEADISDPQEMQELFMNISPDECYHLAAAHHSSEQKAGMDIRGEMLKVNFISTQVMLDALLAKAPACRFFYAGSSQMYTARTDMTVIDENASYSPSSYYGITKVASAMLIDLLRRERGLWGVTGILFNHESTKRGERFLSRKVTHSAALHRKKINAGSTVGDELNISNIHARVDWSAATDFVRAFHLSLQAETPADYVLASGKVHSVHQLLEEAYKAVELDWREFVQTMESPGSTHLPCLQGNPQRALNKLGWEPQKSFAELIKEMVAHDLCITFHDES